MSSNNTAKPAVTTKRPRQKSGSFVGTYGLLVLAAYGAGGWSVDAKRQG